MLGLFKSKNPYQVAAANVYAALLQKTRVPVFYESYAVPDSFDGRFDLLLLHVFVVIERTLDDGGKGAEAFNQALFDETFKDMDQTLREMGIGDMGVPKHMRKMMKAFNGRMHAYKDGLKNHTLQAALEKNLYGTIEVSDDILNKMEQYVLTQLNHLKTQDIQDILAGELTLKEA